MRQIGRSASGFPGDTPSAFRQLRAWRGTRFGRQWAIPAFSDAGRESARMGSAFRHPKNCTRAAFAPPRGAPPCQRIQESVIYTVDWIDDFFRKES
jgi:hypothetical protein